MNNLQRAIPLAVTAGLVAADQFLKQWAMRTLPRGSIEVLPGLFSLSYVENRGAAFGLFQNRGYILAGITGVVLFAILVAFVLGKFPRPFMRWTVALGLAGGIGNLVDRVSRGFVVDYLDFSALWGFPVFNFADCCVVAATALILIDVLLAERAQKAAGAQKEA